MNKKTLLILGNSKLAFGAEGEDDDDEEDCGDFGC